MSVEPDHQAEYIRRHHPIWRDLEKVLLSHAAALSRLKRSFLLMQLMLRQPMDTLQGDDVGAPIRPPDPASMGAFARGAPARSPGVAPPTAGAAAQPAAAVAARNDRPLALGRALARVDEWRAALVIVKPETVIAWHRRGFRLWWTWKSRHRTGRPTLPADVRSLIRTMAQANPLWGAPRIHGELLKLGGDVCQATVAKYMRHRRQPPSQTWRTFLRNHVGQIVAADFFVVPTVTHRLLFVFVLLAHDRRRIRHVAVTAHPTAAWTAQQLREAFPWDEAPRYLIHDRDHAFEGLQTTAKAMRIKEVLTAPRSPWQNPFVERFIGSVRRECLDHVIVFNEAGLVRLMTLYRAFYEQSRTHLSLDKDAPIPRPVMPLATAPSSWRSRKSAGSIIDTNAARPEHSSNPAPIARAAQRLPATALVLPAVPFQARLRTSRHSELVALVQPHREHVGVLRSQ